MFSKSPIWESTTNQLSKKRHMMLMLQAVIDHPNPSPQSHRGWFLSPPVC